MLLAVYGAGNNVRETYLEARDLGGATVNTAFIRRGIRANRWKYILTEPLRSAEILSPESGSTHPTPLPPQELLFDLAADPSESASVAAEYPEVAAAFRAHLDRYRERESPPQAREMQQWNQPSGSDAPVEGKVGSIPSAPGM
jgi:hypothetical protein